MAGTRSSVPASFSLTLDGVPCGFLKAVDGGGASAAVVEEKLDAAGFTKKHLAGVKYGDFRLTIGFGMAQTVYDWIEATLKRSYSRHSGSIVAADMNLQALVERTFTEALITEIGFPALDAASKNAAFLTLSFAPELVREVKASGKVTAGKQAAQKQFVASNFRLELDGVDCTKVTAIDAFTVKQTVTSDQVGDRRDIVNEPGPIDFPNLRVTILEAGAATWSDWFQDFVIKGDNGDDKEKSGAIVFLAPDRKTELGRIVLHNVGIHSFEHSAFQAADKITHVVAGLYCEVMELQIGKPTVVPAPPRPVPRPVKPVVR